MHKKDIAGGPLEIWPGDVLVRYRIPYDNT